MTFANRLPVGPGTRGGRWHESKYRNAYQRAWREAHPEYMERERLRRARQHALARGDDPTTVLTSRPFPRPLPVAAVRCVCECGCRAEVPVVACGFCLLGDHEVTA